jgi:hypothetical protein
MLHYEMLRLGAGVHMCNPIYSGGRDKEDHDSKSAWVCVWERERERERPRSPFAIWLWGDLIKSLLRLCFLTVLQPESIFSYQKKKFTQKSTETYPQLCIESIKTAGLRVFKRCIYKFTKLTGCGSISARDKTCDLKARGSSEWKINWMKIPHPCNTEWWRAHYTAFPLTVGDSSHFHP